MRLVLVGGGGHASDVLGAIEAVNHLANRELTEFIDVVGLVADDEIDMARFKGRGVRQIGALDDLGHLDISHYVVCVGYPTARKAVTDRIRRFGLAAATVVHPRAWLSSGVEFGAGSVALAGVCVSPLAHIGEHVYLSHGVLIGHDTRVLDFVSVMPGASVSGDVTVGRCALIGSNAAVLEKLNIGESSVVGAGAVVTRDIPANLVAKGIPAKF